MCTLVFKTKLSEMSINMQQSLFYAKMICIQKWCLQNDGHFVQAPNVLKMICIWVRSQNWGCLVTWFCYQLIPKPVNKTATVSWPDPFIISINCAASVSGTWKKIDKEWYKIQPPIHVSDNLEHTELNLRVVITVVRTVYHAKHMSDWVVNSLRTSSTYIHQ